MAAAMVPAVYAAAPVEQAQSMIAKGDLNGALKVLDHYLKDSPQDADARFTRGLVLTKLKRTDDAIKVFSALTKDYPQLPEPYNNLAVLYAQQGKYDKARDALEAALATHPSYATASENLGDVYAALAGQAYNHALMLDKNNQQIQYKLSLINKLSAPSAGSSSVAGAAPSAPVDASPDQSVAGSSASDSEAESSENSLSSADEGAIRAAVDGWAGAWSSQNLDDYFSHYSKNFHPANGKSRSAWMKERRQRVGGPQSISVKVAGMQISATGHNRVRVEFKERYESNHLASTTDKELEMVQEGGDWKILSESH